MRPELEDALFDSLAVLTKEELFVLTALFLEGRSYRETARMAGTSPRTIQRRKASGVEKVRNALGAQAEAFLGQAEAIVEDRIAAMPRIPRSVPLAECHQCGTQTRIDHRMLCDRCGPVADETEFAQTMGRR